MQTESKSIVSSQDPDLKKYDLFVDLDQLESRASGFMLHGKVRVIHPVSTIEQFRIANAFNRLRVLAMQEKITGGELYDAYLEIFSMLCDPFSKSDLDDMSQRQCAALYQELEDHITGRVKTLTDEKKNK